FGPGAPRDIGVLAAGAEAHPVPPRHQSPRQARHGVDVPRERGACDDEFGHEHSTAGRLLTCATTLAPCAAPRWTPGGGGGEGSRLPTGASVSAASPRVGAARMGDTHAN